MNPLTQPLLHSGTTLLDLGDLLTVRLAKDIWFWHLYVVWYAVPLTTYCWVRPYGWTPGSFTHCGLIVSAILMPFAIYSAFIHLFRT
jgi:hypothetical protein